MRRVPNYGSGKLCVDDVEPAGRLLPKTHADCDDKAGLVNYQTVNNIKSV